MADQTSGGCCSPSDGSDDGSGCCEPAPRLGRRAFLALSTLGAAGSLAGAKAAAALGLPPERVVVVPADKGISGAALAALRERGRPTSYRGGALQYIGMPVGGITAGRLYLGGDGRLWLWDVNNPDVVTASQWEGGTYREPLTPTSPFRQGFAIRTTASGDTKTRALDAEGFSNVEFTGRYPIGSVAYRADDSLVDVTLEAYSPFVPLDYSASSLPATVMAYTVTNRSDGPVDVVLAGWSENPVCLDARGQRPLRLRAAEVASPKGFQHGAADWILPGDPRPDIVFEDFEGTTYEGWTVEGNAFGPGPVTPDEVPPEMKRFGPFNQNGGRFVTSYAFRAGGDPSRPDGPTGKLISREFTIERRYITVRVGGGHWNDETCVRVVVDGQSIGSRHGNDTEPLRTKVFDVHELEGRQARIEVVDANTGGWGHVNCDYILFTDKPDLPPFDQIQDNGTFALTALDDRATPLPSLERSATVADIFDSGPGPDDVDGSKQTVTGAVRVPFTLAAGESATVRFVVSWHFPVPRAGQFDWLADAEGLRHHYATRFDSASAVAAHLSKNVSALEAATREFVKTWYDDTTLPYWFVERTLAPASTLATTTCYRFNTGRFYGEEGEYCCDGTCQHVWNYAQSVARLFPELERDTRERVDLGIAFKDSGLMGYRGELHPDAIAHDGQAGTILRIYREHQMAPDNTFLTKNWPNTKKALDFLVAHDGEPDGIFENEQYNTLDQTWFGEIPWISGLYIAALRAGAAMATEVGDADGAAHYTKLADTGAAFLAQELWNDEYGYFYHRVDPAHADATNSNRGSFADQLYGETYADQLGLPRIFPVDRAKTALANLYKYNFISDHEGFRAGVEIKGGRWYATQGEAGLLMCAWPFGGDAEAPGQGDAYAVGYFNEVWTGQEYQVAASMFAHGLVDEGLVLTKAVYDRYVATKRNPYNEIECSDHYSRAMMSHGAYLAACGYEHHGPKGHLGFAPKVTPEKFRAAFTAAEGWGSYGQTRETDAQTSTIEIRHGRLRVRTLALEVAAAPDSVVVRLGDQQLAASHTVDGNRVNITLDAEAVVEKGKPLTVRL